MNVVLWVTQFLLAGVFVFTGVSKVLAYDDLKRAVEARTKGGKIGMSRGLAAQVGMLEVVGAVGLVLPYDFWPPYILLRLAAGGLALLMVIATIYHWRRKEHSAPSIGLFLLSLFVVVGRWP
jgi:uncharacterized membrane protein YphA (DoxX/SURF4 family)